MQSTMILTGDVNLLGIADPNVPFKRIADTFRAATVLYGNLECCLYDPPQSRVMTSDATSGYEGFYAPPANGQALKAAGFHGMGNANNQNYGADAIMASNARLDELGILHAGTGRNSTAAREPIIIERNGTRFGFIQRTCQYWPNNHEAGDHVPGVAAMKAYTAYQAPYYKDGQIPPNRPGMPAKIITWTDPGYLAQLKSDLAALRQKSDIVVSSHHWGYNEQILNYQNELAHAAIDSGADVVMGHGPHFPLAIEIYKGKPIFYGLGHCYFVRSNKQKHDNWVGMIARITMQDNEISTVAYSLVRKNDHSELTLCRTQDEPEEIARIERMSAPYGTSMQPEQDRVVVWRK